MGCRLTRGSIAGIRLGADTGTEQLPIIVAELRVAGETFHRERSGVERVRRNFAAVSSIAGDARTGQGSADPDRNYLALDEDHRETVRPIVIARFKNIAKLARVTSLRLSDSIKMTQKPNPEFEAGPA
jgi:hypothetical protein